MKSKRTASALRTARNVQKMKDKGLQHVKVWVHPDEAARVRAYAAKQPLTKECMK